MREQELQTIFTDFTVRCFTSFLFLIIKTHTRKSCPVHALEGLQLHSPWEAPFLTHKCTWQWCASVQPQSSQWINVTRPQNWTHLDPKVPHFWDRRCQRKWNYLGSGDCAEMNIPPDWTKTGNPGTQSIFLKQFNKKMVTFLEKLEKPKAYRVCHLS